MPPGDEQDDEGAKFQFELDEDGSMQPSESIQTLVRFRAGSTESGDKSDSSQSGR